MKAQTQTKMQISVPSCEGWQEMYAAHLAAKVQNPRTRAAYLGDVTAYARWYAALTGETFTPAALYGPDVERWRAKTLAEGKPATWNRRLASLRHLSAWAQAEGLLSFDPLADVPRAREQRLAPKALTAGEWRKLLRQAATDIHAAAGRSAKRHRNAVRDAAILHLMVYAGLRVSEVAGLDAGDVHLGERSGWVQVRDGKGGKDRQAALPKAARRALASWLEMRGAEPGALFVSQKGGRMSARRMQAMVRALGGRCGVEVTPHRLRHTFATNMLREGASLVAVAAQLGHANLQTTMRYTIPGIGDLQAAVERI